MMPTFNPGVNIELGLDQWAAIEHALFVTDKELAQYVADELATPKTCTNDDTFIIYGLSHEDLKSMCTALRSIILSIVNQNEEAIEADLHSVSSK